MGNGNNDLRITSELSGGNDEVYLEGWGVVVRTEDGGNIEVYERSMSGTTVTLRVDKDITVGNIDRSGDTADSITRGTGTQVIKTGGNNDTIDGGGGKDVIEAGNGDDTVTYDINDWHIFGGQGNDTLVITTGNGDDGLPIANLIGLGGSQVTGFETIDLTTAGRQSVRLDDKAVLGLSETGRLVVKGGAEDILSLYGGWVYQGVESDANGALYKVLQNDTAYISVSDAVDLDLSNVLGAPVVVAGGNDDVIDVPDLSGAITGDGDDRITVFSMSFSVIDAGRGTDTIIFDFPNDVNTTIISKTAISNAEIFDLTGNAESNRLIITAEKVISMTDDDNELFVIGNIDKDSMLLYGDWVLESDVSYNGETVDKATGEDGAVIYYTKDLSVTVDNPPTPQMSTFSVAYDDGMYLVSEGIDVYAGWNVGNAGDVNKDGIDDFIINEAGSAYVIFGSPDISGQLELSNLDSKGFKVTGVSSDIFESLNNQLISVLNTLTQNINSQYGRAPTEAEVASAIRNFEAQKELQTYDFGLTGIGDINGDGWDDLAAIDGGSLKIIYGRDTWVSFDLDSVTPDNGLVVSSIPSNYLSIQGVGDVNADGYEDFALGALTADNNGGRVYLIFGAADLSEIDLGDLGQQGVIFKSAPGQKLSLGSDIAALGDINSDGFNDFVIGGQSRIASGQYNPDSQNLYDNGNPFPGGRDYSGSAYIVFGKDEGWAEQTVVVYHDNDQVKPTAQFANASILRSGNIDQEDNISVSFSEPVSMVVTDTAQKYVLLYKSDGTLVEKFDVVTGDGDLGGSLSIYDSSFTLNPFRTLTASTNYYINIDSGVFVDAAGNAFDAITDSSALEFVTTSVTPDAAGPGFSSFYFSVTPFDNYFGTLEWVNGNHTYLPGQEFINSR